MKIVVLGATGGVGMEIVRQALERGHAVTALVRAPGALVPFKARIAVVRGDLLNSVDLERVLEGQDAVLSSFGPRVPIAKADAHLLAGFGAALTKAANRAGVRRIVVVSNAFLFEDSLMPPAHLLGRLFFHHLVEDSSEMEEILRKSGLDWTLVRPPRLTDKPRTGHYRIRDGHLPSFGFTISRADVADFVVRASADPASIGKIVGIAN